MDKESFLSRVRLRHLNCFIVVARERNLGRAAAQLNLTQPAVSKTLTELEEIVGQRLMERGRQGARLTREGEILLPHALAVLDALEAASGALGRGRMPDADAVFIGALPSVAPDLLPASLAAFRHEHPDSRVQVLTAANVPLLEALKSGAVDVAIGRMSDPESMVGLTFELLYVEPLVFAVRPGHPLLAEESPSLAAVLSFPLIVSTPGTVPRHNTESLFHASGLRLPATCVETVSVSVARLLCLRSDCVWIAPAGAVREEQALGALAQLPIAAAGTEEPVGLIRRSEGSLGPCTLHLVELLRRAAVSRRSFAPHAPSG
jgi:DNA-binding transcriptional LysR family regulator